MDSYQLYRGGR